jgi:hypothetical protein
MMKMRICKTLKLEVNPEKRENLRENSLKLL